MELTLRQTQALDALEDPAVRSLVFGGGAGGAKSVLGCYWGLKLSVKYPGVRGVIGRAVLKTLKETTLNTFFWVCDHQGLKNGLHFTYYENKGVIRLFNGSEILLKDLESYPSDPNFDELGSLEITWAFVDECNQISRKAWDILRSRIRYRLDEYGLTPTILGTCNPAKNWVYTDYYGPFKRGELSSDKRFIQSLLNDNEFISIHYRQNLLSLDKASKERLLYGNWDYDDDPSVLCDFDAIMDCFTNKGETGENCISADLAMQGRDRFVAAPWKGLVCDLTRGIDKTKATGKEIEQDLAKLMQSTGTGRSQTIADSDGLGAYLVSYLDGIKEFHGGASAFDKKEFANLKTECGYKLAEVINKRKLRINCSPEQKQAIIEELGVLKSDSVDKDDSKKRIIKKEQMKELLGRSPDYLDMLLMRMWFLVRTRPLMIIEQ